MTIRVKIKCGTQDDRRVKNCLKNLTLKLYLCFPIISKAFFWKSDLLLNGTVDKVN